MPEPSAGAWRLPMAKPDPLDRLARSHGVAGTYVDTGGRTITASAETKRAVLAAMGIPVGTATAEMAGDADVLPPVVVLDRRPGPQRVPIGRRSARWATPTAWHLEREDGTCLEGRTTLRGGALELPGRDLPLGYHQLILTGRGRAAATTLIVAPRRCFLPASARQWGVAMQLYGVRSARNWGIGDFADLGVLAEAAAAEGASCVGINPVHALLTPASGSVSPYSPSSRSFLNALYIAPDGVPELADSAEARAMVAAVAPCLAALRDASLVDHAGVATAKAPVLAALHQAFDERRRRDPGNPRARAFAAFVAAGGAALTRFVTFEALAEVMSAEQDGSHDWREWPARYRRPDAPAVRAFAAANPERLDFHRYLQWLADTQLGEAARRATAAGMPVGLYCDVAVGVHPGGAEAWAEQGLIAAGVSIGAPPDAYNAEGQDWGLAPLNPSGLRAQAYRPFAEVLAANMRHAGALRIDHVMGCMRLFWVPEGQPPTAGTYVAYPFDDLVRIVALESVRQRCVVIGEDLGTVPPGLRARLRRAGMLSYRPLVFERTAGGRFKAPGRWPKRCAAAVSTHDLPTPRGFWSARDVEWRARLGLDADRDDAAIARADAKAALVAALRRAGLLPSDDAAGALGPALRRAVHRYLARTPSRLLLVQLEDLLDELEQANLPGTIDEHPNWRRKVSLPLDRLFADPVVRPVLDAVRRERPWGGRSYRLGGQNM